MCVEDMNRNHVPNESSKKALSLYEAFSKGPPETNGHFHIFYYSILLELPYLIVVTLLTVPNL